jgi:hypothetical protein
MPRYFYRLTLGTEPEHVDFLADSVRGRDLRRPHTPIRIRMHQGLSVYDSLDAAFGRLRQMGGSHHGIAMLDLEGAGVTVEQTSRDTAHHTVWATAEALEGRVHWYLTAVNVATRTG